MSGGAAIAIDRLVARYPGNDRAAVDDVTLAIAPGTITVLLGPSGCGKSTLLRTVNRLVEPISGSIAIDGKPTRARDPAQLRRGIGYAIQAVGLFPHMTVAANIAVVPELAGWARARIAARVDELLALVRLEPARYRARLPRELSGGEQQRVGVARALAAMPPLLLMDEPFGAVDAIVRSSLQAELIEIQRTLGTTILFVTHDVDEALRIGDRLVVMQGGRVLQHDVPLAVLARPATPFVGELVGAGDVVRRLALVPVHRAMLATSQASPGATIAADATLRDVLGGVLGGSDRLTVVERGETVGTIGLAEIRTLLTQESAA